MKKVTIKRLNPPATIGIIGGGQLGRMMVFEAKRMGYNTMILDPKKNSPAGQVADNQILADYDDFAALESLAQNTDVITYEFEHINTDLLSIIESKGYKVYPSSYTLKLIQNKFEQKKMLKNAGIKVPRFHLIGSFEELKETFNKFGNKLILKTCKEGYDGKGNQIVTDINELEEAYKKFENKEVMAEELIDFTKEVSVIVARNHEGVEIYPIAENFHEDSILVRSIVPADVSSNVEKQIYEIGMKIVEEFNDYGIFCIEFFVDSDSNVLVNEIAPRPHNSGHYTIEGCITSQFEQIIRIMTGMPLGSTKLKGHCVMYNLLGSEDVKGEFTVAGLENLLNHPDCYFHLYGKTETNYLKKIGHITAIDDSVNKAETKIKKAISKLEIKNYL
jgi:5-(carboxyamino)imidazole ribonucleotide synthase